jgi:triosephosphate isomerase
VALIVINLKSYEEGWGERGLRIARAAEECSSPKVTFVICPSTPDIHHFAHSLSSSSVEVWAQDADPVPPGSFTGHSPLEALKHSGARGTLINHAERQRPLLEIEFLVKLAKKVSMTACVCSADLQSTRAVARFEPHFVAIEPPELIGGSVSVTSADPEIVAQAVKTVKQVAPSTRVLCGAGVKNGGDVAKALELGTDGVLLASGVVKAKSPEDAIRDLVSKI